MQALIAKEHEPITPFIDRVRQLYDQLGVSTVLVIGGSGDYLDAADSVVAMHAFRPSDVTAQAREIVAAHRTERAAEGGDGMAPPRPRRLAGTGIAGKDDRPPKVKVGDVETIRIGDETIDLSGVEQLLDESQTRAIAEVILSMNGGRLDEALTDRLDRVEALVAAKGLDALTRSPRGDLAAPRRFELAAALNRLRSLRTGQD
jgi:predicted ABC-class ATPase